MSALGIILAFLQAVSEVAPVVRMIMEKNLVKDKALQAAKDELLTEWKKSYASKDISTVVDSLRRLRQSS